VQFEPISTKAGRVGRSGLARTWSTIGPDRELTFFRARLSTVGPDRELPFSGKVVNSHARCTVGGL
jgi:hypothetical protein